ncbi:MAG TPA: DNA polymerase III subunit epsilon [Burkholderiales bacterium]|nr:DNA polymerase III subunit epsilon [Burkholderiales bacterium]
MRRVVLDTETTGLNAGLGDRVIEIGCIEILNRRVTGNHFHRYINPERKSEDGALKVHGITQEFLEDKPKFREIAAEFLDYVQGAELVIHNAAFDIEFLNLELARIGQPPIEEQCAAIVDSLRLARELHPGKKNSLDALCERYQVDHAHRTLHGALLDASLLAEVYLAMTRGQDSLAIELEPAGEAGTAWASQGERPPLMIIRASEEELAQHALLLDAIETENKAPSVWRRVGAAVELP